VVQGAFFLVLKLRQVGVPTRPRHQGLAPQPAGMKLLPLRGSDRPNKQTIAYNWGGNGRRCWHHVGVLVGGRENN